jgi:2-succinyl-5-enolpyruvyl-6-hydroxy-3-cyclohexene-1-carboxylate synthase
MNPSNYQLRGIESLPNICKEYGIEHVVLCPGSRNAPLIISFSNHKDFKLYSITDERSAAYFAMGIAQATDSPVVIVCTSGTAVLNLAPAIAEAYYQNLPLIAITADRPPELIDQADGQTIHQHKIFAPHVKQSVTLPTDTSNDTDLLYSNRLVAMTLDIAIQSPRAPVHINVPLREPLYIPMPATKISPKIIKTPHFTTNFCEEDWQTIVNRWNNASKKMIVAGFTNKKNAALNQILSQLSSRNDCVVIAENLSNLCHSNFIYDPEKFFSLLNDSEKEFIQPDLLISIGNGMVSKQLKLFLRKYKPKEHWQVNVNQAYTDTYHSLTLNIPIDPDIFFREISIRSANTENTNFSNFILQKHQQIEGKEYPLIKTLPFSDLRAVSEILSSLLHGTHLQLANSMTVRYSQLFPSRNEIYYYSNRGTSGIDGCTSTSVGMSNAVNESTVLITGDLAFLYDSNALWSNYLKANLKIIILNNQGGNIFRIINTSSEIDPVLPFFTTPQKVNISYLARGYDVKYFCVENLEQLFITLPDFLLLNEAAILEIKTDAEINSKTYKDYLNLLKL